MGNQHPGAPVLKEDYYGVISCRLGYGSLALRPRQGPGLLNAAPRLPDLRRLPVRHRLLCAAATGRGRRRGGRNKRGEQRFSRLPFANIYIKHCSALQVRRCICAFTASRDKVLREARLLSTLFYSSPCVFDLCVWGSASVCVFVSSELARLLRGRAFAHKLTWRSITSFPVIPKSH